jgi:hypothetical protein
MGDAYQGTFALYDLFKKINQFQMILEFCINLMVAVWNLCLVKYLTAYKYDFGIHF